MDGPQKNKELNAKENKKIKNKNAFPNPNTHTVNNQLDNNSRKHPQSLITENRHTTTFSHFLKSIKQNKTKT